MDEQRQMYQGNWECSGCGKPITELPFEPRDTSNLKCRDCFREQKQSRGGDRKMYEGNWTCAGCGGAITKLPFEPRDTSNLKCRDCFKQDRN